MSNATRTQTLYEILWAAALMHYRAYVWAEDVRSARRKFDKRMHALGLKSYTVHSMTPCREELPF